MDSLRGQVCREKDNIIIKLNKFCRSGKVFYKNRLKDIEVFLIDFENTDEIKFKDPNPENRTFYKVKSENEEVVLAERIIPLKNFNNFRDLGGYETKDNRTVKWGLFYRSEDLSNLKDTDLVYFKSLGIKNILDYRAADECKLSPDVKLDSVNNINIPGMNLNGNNNLDMTVYIKEVISGSENAIDPVELLKEAYKSMPLDNPAYKELFKLFRNPDNTAILQHCTAGKDRTGVGSALILLALNVDEDIVIKDYLKSNDSRKEFNEKIMKEYKDYIINEQIKEMAKSILGVNEDLIKSSLNSIKSKYDSYEDYFEKEYGITRKELENLRNIYLY